jgi:hypothetical protein
MSRIYTNGLYIRLRADMPSVGRTKARTTEIKPAPNVMVESVTLIGWFIFNIGLVVY